MTLDPDAEASRRKRRRSQETQDRHPVRRPPPALYFVRLAGLGSLAATWFIMLVPLPNLGQAASHATGSLTVILLVARVAVYLLCILLLILGMLWYQDRSSFLTLLVMVLGGPPIVFVLYLTDQLRHQGLF